MKLVLFVSVGTIHCIYRLALSNFIINMLVIHDRMVHGIFHLLQRALLVSDRVSQRKLSVSVLSGTPCRVKSFGGPAG